MAITLGDLMAGSRRVVVEYAGAEIGITYRPKVLTVEREARLRAAAARAQESESETMDSESVAYWVELIEAWDVLEKPGGDMLPVTAEVLRRLPAPFLGAVQAAIQADCRPNLTRPKRSGGS